MAENAAARQWRCTSEEVRNSKAAVWQVGKFQSLS